MIPEPHLQVISRRMKLERLSGKEVYMFLINKMWEKPTSEEKIEQELNDSQLIWQKIYMLGITLDSYSRQFHFKITHNILFLNKALNLAYVLIVTMWMKQQYICFRVVIMLGVCGGRCNYFLEVSCYYLT